MFAEAMTLIPNETIELMINAETDARTNRSNGDTPEKIPTKVAKQAVTSPARTP